MKKITLLCSILCLLVVSSIKAQSFTIDDINYNITDTNNNYVEIINSYDITGDLTIPETVTHNSVNYTVTAIADNAFDNSVTLSYLTSITLPSTIQTIGDSAFFGNGLTSLTLPEGVESIGDYAFDSNKITNITLPASLTTIGDSAFLYNINLTKVTSYSNDPATIDANTFFGISGTLALTIPYGTTAAYADKGWTAAIFNGGITEMASPTSTITFDDQGYTEGQVLGQSFNITNNGQEFTFVMNNVDPYLEFQYYQTSIFSNNDVGGAIGDDSADTSSVIIKTTDGTEIDFGGLTFINDDGISGFSDIIKMEGFKDNVSTGFITFDTKTSDPINVDVSNNNMFSDVDEVRLTNNAGGFINFNYFIDNIVWSPVSNPINNTTTATHLNFDGNDYVTGTNPNLPEGNDPRTIEMWVKAPSNTNYQVLYNYGVTTTNKRASLMLHQNKLYYAGEYNDLAGSIVVADDQWHHVAATFDGTTLKLYVDGVQDGIKTTTFNTDGTTFDIGKRINGTSEYYTGNIDEVRVWNTARTQAELNAYKDTELQGNETGLVAYHNFNQGVSEADNTSVTTLNDNTGGANTGTLNSFTLTGTISNWLASSPITSGVSDPAPYVTSVNVPVDGTYSAGNNLDFTVNFSENVTVTGTPQLALTIGTETKYATYQSGTGTNELVFSYTVENTDLDLDGITVDALELNNGTIQDATANNADLSLANVADTSGIIVKNIAATHLNFDGVDNYVALPEGIVSSATDFTFEAMVNYTDNGVWERVFDFGNNTTEYMFLTLDPSTKQTYPRFGITTVGGESNEEQINSDIPVPTGWFHIAVTIKDGVGTMYINGEQVGQNTSMNLNPTSLGTTTNNYLGKSQFSDPNFKGDLDEVRIWSTARSQAEIQAYKDTELQGDETGLIAYYNFNQGVSETDNTAVTNLSDSSTNNNDGTLNSFTLNGSTSNWLAGSPVTSGVSDPKPYITNVTSTTANGTYGVGATINVTVTFSEVVNITNTPQITLETGDVDRVAAFVSVNNNEASFTYTVQAGDNSTDLDYLSTTALALNGGTLKDDLNVADGILLLPAPGTTGSLASNKDIEIDRTLSNTTFNTSTISLYPNPVQNVLTVQLTNNNYFKSVSIYDITGKKVKSSNSTSVNLNSLNTGMYLVKIETTNGTTTKKIIKQ